MGRPSRGRMDKLLTIRCSDEEHAGIEARATAFGRSMSDWARETLLAVPLPGETPPDAEDLLGTLRRENAELRGRLERVRVALETL